MKGLNPVQLNILLGVIVFSLAFNGYDKLAFLGIVIQLIVYLRIQN